MLNLAGQPGTGKTTRVARFVIEQIEQERSDRRPLIALAAPTGKAAVRLQEAVHEEADRLDVSAQTRAKKALPGGVKNRTFFSQPPGKGRRRPRKEPFLIGAVRESGTASCMKQSRHQSPL